ncbi:MAG: hypothetical protein OXM61_13215 [Candidatus Poribacteria bacterium]|nr:hypothetical protein [Candidatus Poribacteria bacterium]
MAQYDEIVKHLMHRYADAFAMLSFGTPDVQVLETLDTEQQTVKVHRNDMTFKVLWHNEVVLLHIEVQTEDSRDKPMPLRMLAYASELLLRHELPVYSVVIYLSPNAGQTDPSGYSYGNDVFGLQYKYQVIRLADLEGESFLEAASVGLLPFTPLMKPPEGMDAETWLEKCVEKTVAAPVDSQTRGTLLFAMTTLSSLVHDLTFLQRLISEEMMREFPFIEHLKQQGARENSINNIQSVLTTRFPQSDVQGIEHALESIQDLEYLSTLLLTAIDTPSVEVFLQELNGSET